MLVLAVVCNDVASAWSRHDHRNSITEEQMSRVRSPVYFVLLAANVPGSIRNFSLCSCLLVFHRDSLAVYTFLSDHALRQAYLRLASIKL